MFNFKNANIMENNSFTNISGFGTSLLGSFLQNIFWPYGNITLPTLPTPSSEALEAYNNESKDATEEKRRELIRKYLDPDGIMDKYFEKIKDPIQFAKLNTKLIKINAKIAVLNKKKQSIVDEWVNSSS